MLAHLICWLLGTRLLTGKTREHVVNHLLTKIGAFPTHAIITVDEGKLFIRGVPVEGERAYVLRHGAQIALDNIALRAVHEEVLYKAISQGIHLSQNFEHVQFAKAAVWYGQQERELLKLLASQGTANSSLNGD
jgi:hypothetical protein